MYFKKIADSQMAVRYKEDGVRLTAILTLSSAMGCTTVVSLAQDASSKVDWPHVISQIADLNITVLVNNVGTPNAYTTLEKASDEDIEIVMRTNSIFPTQLTRNLLPTLIQNSPSLILNICSASSYAPMALLGIYCGTKASNLVWSESLYNELRLMKRDVDCKAVMTGSVSSGGHNIPVTAFAPAADDYAKSMLARAGSSGPVYNGYWRHSLQIVAIHIIKFFSPSLLETLVTGVTLDLLKWRASIGDEAALKVADIPV